jgi:hypothetical protein
VRESESYTETESERASEREPQRESDFVETGGEVVWAVRSSELGGARHLPKGLGEVKESKIVQGSG